MHKSLSFFYKKIIEFNIFQLFFNHLHSKWKSTTEFEWAPYESTNLMVDFFLFFLTYPYKRREEDSN
jgi:hypothetical protein